MKRILVTFIAASMILAGCGGSSVDGGIAKGVTPSVDTTVPQQTEGSMPSESAEDIDTSGSPMAFQSEDIYGSSYSDRIYANNKLTMINVFATWCGPCVQEMPELAEISRDYASKGVGIIGFVTDARGYGSIDDAAIESAKSLMSSANVPYPFIIPDEGFVNGYLFTEYVPTTYFVDSSGQFVGEPVVGSNDYSGWAGIIEERLSMI